MASKKRVMAAAGVAITLGLTTAACGGGSDSDDKGGNSGGAAGYNAAITGGAWPPDWTRTAMVQPGRRALASTARSVDATIAPPWFTSATTRSAPQRAAQATTARARANGGGLAIASAESKASPMSWLKGVPITAHQGFSRNRSFGQHVPHSEPG